MQSKRALSSSQLNKLDPSILQNSSEAEKALIAFISVLAPYDSDQLFPLYGVSDQNPLFALNGHDLDHAECEGVNGLLSTYREYQKKAARENADPASDKANNFHPIVDHLIHLARVEQEAGFLSKYFVLFLVVSSDNVNVEALTKTIIGATSHPISIILVGVGSSEFPNLASLDADDKPLVHDKKPASRDIVQFVHISPLNIQKSADLSHNILAEIPNQVCSFMSMCQFSPKNI